MFSSSPVERIGRIYRRRAFKNWHKSPSLVRELIFSLSNSPVTGAKFPQLPSANAVAQHSVCSFSLSVSLISAGTVAKPFQVAAFLYAKLPTSDLTRCVIGVIYSLPAKVD